MHHEVICHKTEEEAEDKETEKEEEPRWGGEEEDWLYGKLFHYSRFNFITKIYRPVRAFA